MKSRTRRNPPVWTILWIGIVWFQSPLKYAAGVDLMDQPEPTGSARWMIDNDPQPVFNILDFGAKPGDGQIDTGSIQQAIDVCAEKGGGTVVVPAGTFISGSLMLESKMKLKLEQGAVLQGSDTYQDYVSGWGGAFINGNDLESVTIAGKGTIDGVDCINPKGEEGFRGPHGIALTGCRDIAIQGITITRAANYAIIFRDCANALIGQVVIRGGHDGINAWDSSQVSIVGCDIRTGDDAIAGTNNRDFKIYDCKLNSSCNAFRFACSGLHVRNCRLWGPGEYSHKISKRNNMLSAFVHFSPEGKGTLKSDKWLVEDITVENAIHLYLCDVEYGQWQTGAPVGSVRFKNVKATGIQQPVTVVGDRQTELVFDQAEIEFAIQSIRNERTPPASREDGFAFNIKKIGRFELNDVTVSNRDVLAMPVVRAERVGAMRIRDFHHESSTHPEPIVTVESGFQE